MSRTNPDWVYFTLETDGSANWLRPGGAPQSGALSRLAQCGATHWCWLFDGRQVQLTAVVLPPANARSQQQALPFALEEQLLGPLHDLVFASRRLSRTELAVAVVARAALESGLARCHEAGIGVSTCVVDSLCVPWSEGEGTLALVHDAAWLRCGVHLGFRFAPANWPAFFAQAQQTLGAPARLRWVGDPPPPAGVASYTEPLPASRLAWLAAGHLSDTPLDLLDALPRRAQAAPTHARRWWWATAAVVTLTLGVHLGLALLRGAGLDRALIATRAQEIATGNALFPHIKRVVDVRAQATQALAELAAAPAQGSSFEALLRVAGTPLASNPEAGVWLASVSYERGALEVRVQAPDMAKIEGYQQRLRDSGLALQVLSVESHDDLTVASLRLGKLQ
ncbi:MAG: hypothetical protein EXR83_06860 [Gammaproteobacteria bacterium]|nr:hypothetical protein [Gammaproteobacteria bacterium]